MAQFFLHYGGHSFDLADAEAAIEARDKIRWARANNNGGGEMVARTAGGIVVLYLSPGIPVALSANGAGAERLDEEKNAGGGEAY